MRKNTSYFENVDNPDIIIRKQADMFELEYISPNNPVWTKTTPNSSYEREYYLGEGNCCLFAITYEEAKKQLAKWGITECSVK